MAPIALGVEIAEIEPLLHAEMDRRDGAGDLAGDESFAADRALVIEQDAVRGVDAVGLAIVDRNPVGVELGRRIRRARIERRRLVLRNRLRLAVEFRGRGLVEADTSRTSLSSRIASSRRSVPSASTLAVYSGRLEGNLHMRLRREIVDLVGLRLLDDADQIGGVGQVAIVQDEARIGIMRILVEMLDPPGVEARRPTLDAVHLVALGEQQFGEIGAVLAGDAGDQSHFVLVHGVLFALKVVCSDPRLRRGRARRLAPMLPPLR